MSSRIPISLYLSILAGIVVIFNHYAASETGDVALNKVTGAAGRFYTVFRDTALTFQLSHLQTALCGPTSRIVLPHNPAKHFWLRYCHESAQDSERMSSGRTPSDRRHHGGYGGSDVAFVNYGPLPVRSSESFTSDDRLFGLSPFVLGWSKQRHFSRLGEIWERCRWAIETMGVLFLRTCASWWWFRAPVGMTGVLLAIFVFTLTIGYLFEANEVVQSISQAYVVVVVDFLQSMEWEAQRHVWGIVVSTIEGAYGGAVVHGTREHV